MRGLINSIKSHATLVSNDRAQSAKYGIVTSYDAAHHAAKVMLQPEEVETGWLPVAATMAGDGWGIFSPPSPGEMVIVHFQEDGAEAGFVAGRFFSDADRPTVDFNGERQGCPSGEIWLAHKSGSIVQLKNGGDIAITSTANLSIAVVGAITTSAESWAHTGNISITGGLTASEDIVGKGVSLYGHAHGSVQAGSGESGPPVGGGSGGGGGGGGGGSGISAGDGAAAGDYLGSIM